MVLASSKAAVLAFWVTICSPICSCSFTFSGLPIITLIISQRLNVLVMLLTRDSLSPDIPSIKLIPWFNERIMKTVTGTITRASANMITANAEIPLPSPVFISHTYTGLINNARIAPSSRGRRYGPIIHKIITRKNARKSR